MTKREFLEAIKTGNMSVEVQETAKTMLATMESQQAKRKALPSKNAKANKAYYEIVKKTILEAGTPCTAVKIAETIELSVQKVNAILRQMTKENELVRHEISRSKPFEYSLFVNDEINFQSENAD